MHINKIKTHINKIKQLRGLFFFLRNHRLRQPCRNAYPHHIYHITTCINSPSHNLAMRRWRHKYRQRKSTRRKRNTHMCVNMGHYIMQQNPYSINESSTFYKSKHFFCRHQLNHYVGSIFFSFCIC